jgi:hypothetical protein
MVGKMEHDATKQFLIRREAAAYITARCFPYSPETLATDAVRGTGPVFQLAGRIPVYTPANLDAWALSRIGPEVRSTSEAYPGRTKPKGRPRKLGAALASNQAERRDA